MSEHRLLYITTRDKEEAVVIGLALLEEKLVACVNILNSMDSMYWWKGEIQSDTESVLIAKTVASRVELVTERVKSLHGYECPCILSFEVDGGNHSYLSWIANETAHE